MTGASESFADHLPEPPAEPGPDEDWTSDRECDRLAPLTASLQHWAGVYDRWRRHAPACARPAQPPFGSADLAAIDGLRGVHFGRLAALSRRLRTVAAALTRIGESTAVHRSAVAEAWRDDSAQRVVQRFDRFERDTQDCATGCDRLGLHLHCAIVDTVAPVVSSAVQEILARSGGWQRLCGNTSRAVWEQRIAELDAGHPAGPADQWRVELDELVIAYDAVIGLFRATLDAAETTVSEVYQALHREFGARVPDLFGAGAAGTEPAGAAPVSAEPAGAAPVSAEPAGAAPVSAEPAPAATALASAGPVGADEPSSGSSAAGGGGGAGAPAGPVADGSALLGELSDPPVGDRGAATPAAPSDAVGYGAGAATAGSGVVGSGVVGSGAAGGAPPAGFLGGPADDQPRPGRSWPPPAGEDREREASWARLRALLGEDAGEYPEQHGTGR